MYVGGMNCIPCDFRQPEFYRDTQRHDHMLHAGTEYMVMYKLY